MLCYNVTYIDDFGRETMDTNILLESGTNELEILEFALGDNHYGINVAKIKEIDKDVFFLITDSYFVSK